jgi:16S rRNA (uracil1498-N3)-methyltransferase
MKRFLVPDELQSSAHVRLSPEETKHALRVLRLAIGDKILLTNGRGVEAEAVIVGTEKTGALVEVLLVRAAIVGGREARLEIVQAPLKGPRMDWLVEKITELGVDSIHLVHSRFSVASGEKIERWQRLAQAAMKQSGNLRPPEIHPIAGLQEILPRFGAQDALFLLSPTATTSLAQSISLALRQQPKRVVLAIGPEGGFSPEEEKEFLCHGFLPCLLSPQILRGETAALSATAVALHTLDFPA